MVLDEIVVKSCLFSLCLLGVMRADGVTTSVCLQSCIFFFCLVYIKNCGVVILA